MTSLTSSSKQASKWNLLLAARKEEQLMLALQEAPLIEVASFLEQHPLDLCLRLFLLFKTNTQALLFGHLHEGRQKTLYRAFSRTAFACIFVEMEPDLRADFYQKLDEIGQAKLLPYLPKQVRQDVVMLSAYSPTQAGGIMRTDFVTLDYKMNAEAALNKVRQEAPSEKMIYQLYVVNEEKKMVGMVSLNNLIMANPLTKLTKFLQENVVAVKVKSDRELVAQQIEKYDLLTLPVINEEGQLLGVVTHDDAMEVIRAEQTEDMERFMGIVSDEAKGGYLQASSFSHFKKRISWMILLFCCSFAAGLLLHHYDGLLQHMAILALYMPTINDAGGNAGSQAAMVVIRALSLGELSHKQWPRILWKEVKVALLFASCFFPLALFKVYLLSGLLAKNYGSHLPLPAKGLWGLALTVSMALSLQIITSILIGAALPLVIHALGKDPALAASPAITTIVDMTGLFFYFSIASYLLL